MSTHVPAILPQPILGNDVRTLVEEALRALSDHVVEMDRAAAAGLDVTALRQRNATARAALERIHATYFKPEFHP